MDAEDREPYGTADKGDSARWMTFAELGAARGISKASAIKLVRRHGWRRQRDNQGHVRALVPLTWAEREGDGEPDSPPDVSTDTGIAAGALAALETAVMTLREQLDAAHFRADGERQRADDLRAQIDEPNAEMTVMRAEADTARCAAEALAERERERTDDERQGREQERARADRAEAGITGERQRADTLRGRIDAMQAQIAEANAAAEQEHAQAQAAQDAAEALRRPTTPGRRGGLWRGSGGRGEASSRLCRRRPWDRPGGFALRAPSA